MNPNERKLLIMLEDAGEHGMHEFEIENSQRVRGSVPALIQSLRDQGHDVRREEDRWGIKYVLARS